MSIIVTNSYGKDKKKKKSNEEKFVGSMMRFGLSKDKAIQAMKIVNRHYKNNNTHDHLW